MTVKYQPKDSSVTIKLSWTEIRQFLSGYGIEMIQNAIKKAIDISDKKTK